MKSIYFAVLLVCVTTTSTLAQTLTHVRIETPDAPTVAWKLEREGFDVLEGSITQESLDIIATQADLESLENQGIELQIIAVSRPFREIQSERQLLGRAPPAGYPDLATILAEMNAYAAAYPSICQVVDLTTTYGAPPTFEDRHIYAVKISDNVTQDEDEPAYLVVSNHHARELVTPVIALYSIEQLTTRYGRDPTITALVDEYEIWIAPTWNPDGYEYVFEVNNMWRKNRRVFATGIGVDLNRNYPFGWYSPCSGSTDPSSETYKGPSPASESETQTMVTWSQDRHYAKLLDFHSSGRETLYAYACLSHPFVSFLQQEAIAISTASGYGGSVRPPSADGEHYQWQLAMMGVHAFLTETHTTFQPTYASAQAEAIMVFPSLIWQLQRPISIFGHVTALGQPVVATITYIGVNFQNGETNTSDARFGRHHSFLPAGSYTLEFATAGHAPLTFYNIVVNAGQATQLDVNFGPTPPIAQDISVSTAVGTPATFTLIATDDGLPDPPGALTYIITSLPAHGDLTDPGSGPITSVPYTLVGYGNQVDYQPVPEYRDMDSLQFKANDGGVPPDGGDSNIATVTITVGGPNWDPVAYNVNWPTGTSIPTDIPLSASDPNGDPLTYIIESLPNDGSLSDPGAGPINSVPHTLVGGGNIVHYQPPWGQNLVETFDFSARDATAGSNIATVTVTVGVPQMVYNFPMDSDPGWSTEGDWDFGQPTGSGGSNGYDPNSGYTGTNVYGYNLDGYYDNNMPVYYLTTTALDCTFLSYTELRFRRWLGVENGFWDHANIEVSINGSAWVTVWEHTGGTMVESSWSFHSYDISTVADGEATVYLRWGMGPTDSSNTYAGWNIDDVEIWALQGFADCNGNAIPDEQDILSGTSQDCNQNGIPDECDIAEGTSDDCDGNGIPDECDRANYGDVNGDGNVDLNDVLCMLDGLGGLFTCSGVAFAELNIAPCGGDLEVNLYDLLALLDAISGQPPCPEPCP